jgi:hypothetical protein
MVYFTETIATSGVPILEASLVLTAKAMVEGCLLVVEEANVAGGEVFQILLRAIDKRELA